MPVSSRNERRETPGQWPRAGESGMRGIVIQIAPRWSAPTAGPDGMRAGARTSPAVGWGGQRESIDTVTMARITIVDDNPANSLPLSRLLQYQGHKVQCILRST